MAKIRVFEKTREIDKNIKGLSNKMDKLKTDIDRYFQLMVEAKRKVEEKARLLEEERKREELLVQERKRLEEEKRKEEERRIEEEKRLKAEKLEKERQQEKLKLQEERLQLPKEIMSKQDEKHRGLLELDSDMSTIAKEESVTTTSQQKEVSDEDYSFSKNNKIDTKKESYDNRYQQKGRHKDIVDEFITQPDLVSGKGRLDSGRSFGGRHSGDQGKDKIRRKKKDYWEDSNYNRLNNIKSKKPNKEKKEKQVAPPPERKKAFTMGDVITVKDLSEKIGIQVSEIIKKLLNLGVLATINKELDYDTASLIASEFNIELERKAVKSYEEQLEEIDIIDDEYSLVERPPVVTVMGHVDHGKTSLLDAIRNAHVTEGEAGGITQHIGAYTVRINSKTISFIDTPGHEAFTSMRARGAQVTDIAVLVVAADDGVMPQTVEAINHAKAAGVPIIVAINKIDKRDSNPDRIKQELSEHGLIVEEWGGDTIAVPVSALKKEGISELLEMILLVAEMRELKANPNRLAKGTIIEAQLDKGRGPVATVLVQNGTLRIGDPIVAGTVYGKVRAMMDDKGNRIKETGPSTPVEVLGFNEVPEAGDVMYAVEDEKLARQVSEERKEKMRSQQIKATSKASLDDLFNQLKEGEIKDLNIIIKADVQGSVEAVRQALEKLSNDQVRIRVIHGGVGAVSESDVILASASNAIIIGFNVRPSTNSIELAEKEGIDIRTYRVIYNAIEDIEAAMKGLLDPEYKEVVIGHASVRTIFKISGTGTIAGSYVTDGKIVRNAGIRLVRDGTVVYEGKMASLKRFKDDVREVTSNYECGIMLENYNDIKEGDVLEAFVMEEIKR